MNAHTINILPLVNYNKRFLSCFMLVRRQVLDHFILHTGSVNYLGNDGTLKNNLFAENCQLLGSPCPKHHIFSVLFYRPSCQDNKCHTITLFDIIFSLLMTIITSDQRDNFNYKISNI